MSARHSTADLCRYLPHRPPMIWVDWVTQFSPAGGECVIDVKDEALYMSPQGLRASACIEFMAQAYGFIWICHETQKKGASAKGMSTAMLAAFKDVQFAPAQVMRSIKGGDHLRCRISNVRFLGPITSFHGEVWHGDTRLASGQMRAYSQHIL